MPRLCLTSKVHLELELAAKLNADRVTATLPGTLAFTALYQEYSSNDCV